MEVPTIRRRYRLLTNLSIALALLATVVRAEVGEPELRSQSARVKVPGAAVRSGPGENYYLTDTLPEDSEVDVYHRRPDGWCAIRPPADSFSWVFVPHVHVAGDGVAKIEKEDVAARVGSRLSAQRDVVQVRLHKGECVSILGRDDRDGSDWYKIAPPAGEFRWVRAEDLGLGAPSAESPVKLTSGELEPPPLASPGATGSTSLRTGNDQWTAAKSLPPPATSKSNTPSADISPLGPGAATSADLGQQLTDLELRLSRMVSESPATWNIAPLEQAAEQLLSRSDTVADREAVKATLQKIDRFSAIHRRYSSTTAATMNSISPNSISPAPVGAATSETGAANSPYDAVGILRPVVSRRPGAPQFALVNDQGQVLTFVTASPDMNLQPYVGQRIGVTGSRGYIPEFRRAHVTAGRVSPINERMLR